MWFIIYGIIGVLAGCFSYVFFPEVFDSTDNRYSSEKDDRVLGACVFGMLWLPIFIILILKVVLVIVFSQLIRPFKWLKDKIDEKKI